MLCTIVAYKSLYKNNKNRKGHRYSKTNVIMGKALDGPLSYEMRSFNFLEQEIYLLGYTLYFEFKWKRYTKKR